MCGLVCIGLIFRCSVERALLLDEVSLECNLGRLVHFVDRSHHALSMQGCFCVKHHRRVIDQQWCVSRYLQGLLSGLFVIQCRRNCAVMRATPTVDHLVSIAIILLLRILHLFI